MSRRSRLTPSVVDAVREQTEQAAALAAIDGQARLADPRLNPATRGHAELLRGEQLIRALDAEHARLLRRHRVADQSAADAEEALQAVQLARQASSPALSVLALHKGKRRFLRVTMAASLVLSTGSAMGVDAAAQYLGAPTGTGYVAEVGLTGMSTAVVLYLSHLTEHGGRLDRDAWQGKVLVALMAVPLLVSVAANLGTLNVIGAFCAVGAVAFSALSYIVADRSSATMQERADEVTGTDVAKLYRTAMGDDLFAAVVAEPQTGSDQGQDDGRDDGGADEDDDPDDGRARGAVDAPAATGQYLVMVGPEPTADDEQVDEEEPAAAQESDDSGGRPAGQQDTSVEEFPVPVREGERLDPGAVETVTDTVVAMEVPEGLRALERFLADQDPPAGEGSKSSAPDPRDSGPDGAARTAPDEPSVERPDESPADASIRPEGQIDGDQRDPLPDPRPDRGSDRGAGGEGSDRVLPATRARLAAGASTRHRVAEYWDQHPGATVSQMVRALGLSRSTVKRYRREIREIREIRARGEQRSGEQQAGDR